MSRKMRSDRIVACLLLLAIAGAIGMGPTKAEGQLLTPTMAVRFGAAEESGRVLHAASYAVPLGGGGQYAFNLAVLEQRTTSCFPWIPVPPDGPIIPAPRTTDSASATAGPSEWAPGYRQIRVLRVIDVTTEPWAELSSIEYEESDWPLAVEFVELPNHLVVAVLMSDRMLYYTLDGQPFGETLLPDSIDGHPVTAYSAFDVAYTDGDIDLQPLVFVVGSAMNADGIPCAVCVAPDDNGGLAVAWKKTYPEFVGEALMKVSAATDGTSAFLICLSGAAQLVRNRVLEIRCVDGEDGGTVSTLLTSEDPLTEFADVVAVVDVARDVRMYYALGNEQTPEGGTRAALYYWIVDEFAPIYTGSLCVAEPGEPGGNVCGEGLIAKSNRRSTVKSQDLCVAGTTEGQIEGGPPPLGGTDVWLATVQLDITGFDVDYISPVWRYGGPGDDTFGAMAVGQPDDGQSDLFPIYYPVYLAINTASDCSFNAGAIQLESVGGIGTDPTIVELKTPAAMIADLIAKVEGMNLHQGIDNSLDVKLENAMRSLDSVKAGNRQDAVNKLEAFINECVAQSGNKLTPEQANELIEYTVEIIAAL